MAYRHVSEIARQLGTRPRTISDLFYSRQLSDETCPIVGGRRLIPDDYVGEIERLVRERGLIPGPTAEAKE